MQTTILDLYCNLSKLFNDFRKNTSILIIDSEYMKWKKKHERLWNTTGIVIRFINFTSLIF